jgi:hypothetical protein
VLLTACADPYASGVATVPAGAVVRETTVAAAVDTRSATPVAPASTVSPTVSPSATPLPAPTAAPTALPTVAPAPARPPAGVDTVAAPLDATPSVTPRAHGDPATPSLLDTSRVVSIYGVPGVPVMGLLGALDPEAAAAEVASLAREYAALDPARPVIPAFHLIVDVAQASPGADGTYLGRLSAEQVQTYIDVAREHQMLLFLDVQVGWSDPLTEVRRLAPYLAEPFVHVALDPEFATAAKREAPGLAIGMLTAEQVNAVQDYLGRLVRDEGLPPKILVVHQFLEAMLDSPERFARTPGVSLVIDMDGFGTPALKLFKYDRYALAPYAEYPGIKLFERWDTPLMTPSAVLALPDPPRLVIYQ